jgi:hypothetical protein
LLSAAASTADASRATTASSSASEARRAICFVVPLLPVVSRVEFWSLSV